MHPFFFTDQFTNEAAQGFYNDALECFTFWTDLAAEGQTPDSDSVKIAVEFIISSYRRACIAQDLATC